MQPNDQIQQSPQNGIDTLVNRHNKYLHGENDECDYDDDDDDDEDEDIDLCETVEEIIQLPKNTSSVVYPYTKILSESREMVVFDVETPPRNNVLSAKVVNLNYSTRSRGRL